MSNNLDGRGFTVFKLLSPRPGPSKRAQGIGHSDDMRKAITRSRSEKMLRPIASRAKAQLKKHRHSGLFEPHRHDRMAA